MGIVGDPDQRGRFFCGDACLGGIGQCHHRMGLSVDLRGLIIGVGDVLNGQLIGEIRTTVTLF